MPPHTKSCLLRTHAQESTVLSSSRWLSSATKTHNPSNWRPTGSWARCPARRFQGLAGRTQPQSKAVRISCPRLAALCSKLSEKTARHPNMTVEPIQAPVPWGVKGQHETAGRKMKMFKQLIVLGLRSGTIYRVDIPHGRVDTLYNKAGPEPDGVVVENGIVYWTTMGTPTPDPSADDGFDFPARNGGLHSVWLDGSGARDVIPTGTITTGKQLASDGAGTLYWGDREGSRVSRVRIDGTGLMDLVVNTPDDTKLQECVGVAVDPARGSLYWTQKGPANGGKGRIFRAGLGIPAGQTAANRTDIEVLWNSLPEPIDLEIKGEWLYWTDRGDPPTGNTLNRAPLPAAGASGRPPEILAGGFHEDIGLALDGEADVADVTALGGRIHVVPISESAKGSNGARVLADLHEPLTGLAGLKASEL